MPTFRQRQQELAEALKDKFNSLLENDSDIEVNSIDELQDKFKELTNPYHNLPEIKHCIVEHSTSADGWKYAKNKHAKNKYSKSKHAKNK